MTRASSNTKLSIFICSLLSMGFFSCKKFVEIPPPQNQLQTANVFTNDATATATVTGMYANMFINGFASGNSQSITLLSGLSADEYINFGGSGYIEFVNNNLSATNLALGGIWNGLYQTIYASNATMEGLKGAKGMSDSVRQQLTGEATFIRAFCYFYATNLFGDVPLNLTTNYQTNAATSRTPSSLVYNQIVADLTDAQSKLSSDFSYSNGERVRPNKWAATSLLARVYLYQQKWDSAEAQSTAVINNSTLFGLTGLDSVFLANSSEAIWQLLPLSPGNNTNEGQMFILTAPPTLVALSSYVTNAFELGDSRLDHWVGNFSNGSNNWNFPYKYKVHAGSVLTEYSMVLRLAEQYLIRAEARAELNTNILGAQNDLNIIRTRAGLPNTSANDQTSLLSAIAHERQVELFSEWGHRWLDLIRTGQADAILGTEKPGWKATAKLYPIPAQEIQNNPKSTQNAGY